MSELIALKDSLNEIAKLENELRKGGVIVIPVEGSYVYVADAFNIGAVKRIHELRGDEPGVALSVAIGRVETLTGICAAVSEEIKKLAKIFWPGFLTLYVQPNASLSWDLGDGNELGEFAVRIPDSKLLIALANNIGPLAFSSAALASKGAARNLDDVSALLGEIDFYVDGGALPESELSTVVRAKVIGSPELEAVRIGAISLKELQDAIPSLSMA
jgi:tRNA threonylcarbamoyl adenosine modification protein (Sua5/YciO/YrdC/YwlC family)